MQADLLLACKPVQQVAITVHVAILALQTCLVSHTRHLNPPSGKTKNFNGLKNLVIISIWKTPNNHERVKQEPEKSTIKKLIQTLGSC